MSFAISSSLGFGELYGDFDVVRSGDANEEGVECELRLWVWFEASATK